MSIVTILQAFIRVLRRVRNFVVISGTKESLRDEELSVLTVKLLEIRKILRKKFSVWFDQEHEENWYCLVRPLRLQLVLSLSNIKTNGGRKKQSKNEVKKTEEKKPEKKKENTV